MNPVSILLSFCCCALSSCTHVSESPEYAHVSKSPEYTHVSESTDYAYIDSTTTPTTDTVFNSSQTSDSEIKNDTLRALDHRDSVDIIQKAIVDKYYNGSVLRDFAQGDINQDGKTDFVLVLNDICDKEIQEALSPLHSSPEWSTKGLACRKVALLLKSDSFEYSHGPFDPSLVDCSACGSYDRDEYYGIAIIDGNFIIANIIDYWTLEIGERIYKYNKKMNNWFLSETFLATTEYAILGPSRYELKPEKWNKTREYPPGKFLFGVYDTLVWE